MSKQYLPLRLRNLRKSGKPIDTCLEAADYIERLEAGLYDVVDTSLEPGVVSRAKWILGLEDNTGVE